MGDLIFKPASGGVLKLQDAGATDRIQITDGGSTILYDEGGSAALTMDTSGVIQIACNLAGALQWSTWTPAETETYASPSTVDNNIPSSFVTFSGTSTVTITFAVAGRYEVLTHMNVRLGNSVDWSTSQVNFGGTATRYFYDTQSATSGDDMNFSTMAGGLISATASQTTTVNPQFRVKKTAINTAQFHGDCSITVKYLGGTT